jgi:Protein of unknown function (DUF4031)
MILVDNIGHMVSSEDADELHEFARELGLKREWYQTPRRGEYHAHYDLNTRRMIAKAKRMGAKRVKATQLIHQAWWRK